MKDKSERNPTDDLTEGQFWHHFGRYPYQLARLVFIGLLVVGVIFVVRAIEGVLFPVLVSLLIAYLLDPMIDWFEAKGFSRTISILIFLALGTLAGVLFMLVLYPTIAHQVANVGTRLPQVVETVETKIIPWAETSFGVDLPSNVSSALSEYGEVVSAELPNVANRVTTWLSSLLGAAGPVLASLMNLVMIPVFTFYFLRDFDIMRVRLIPFIPRRRRASVLKRIRMADEVVGAWFRGQLQVAGILGVLYAVGLGILFSVVGVGGRSGVSIGILTGLLNVVPYLGVLVGLILSLLVVLIDWTGPGGLVGVAVVFGVVQVLEGYVITPKIVGEKVGLSPVVVIIVLLLGGEVFGLMGVLLAIPVAGIVRVLIPDLVKIYAASPFYSGKYDGGDTDGLVVDDLSIGAQTLSMNHEGSPAPPHSEEE